MDDERRPRLLDIAARLPEVDVEDGQHIGFSVRRKRFAWYLDDHHGDGIVALSCRAAPGQQEFLVAADPERYLVPAYTGHRGWVSLRLDLGEIDWDEVEELFVDAYLLAAPKRLAAEAARGSGQ